jgi:hypothetical protein
MTSIPSRASRTQEFDLEEDDPYYTQRPHTSAVRYTQPRQQVIQQGNKRIIIHNEPPPSRRLHWSFLLGLGMMIMLSLWVVGSYALTWWSNHQLDSQYGMPRTYQTDAVVYPADSSDNPSHYIFLNLNGAVISVELPHDDPSHARIYKGPMVYSNDPSYTPVTGDFKEIGGKMEMIVHVGDQQFIYVNDGTQFKPQQ